MKESIFKISVIAFIIFNCSCKKENSSTLTEPVTATTETIAADSLKILVATKISDTLQKGDYCFKKAENKDTTIVRLKILSNDNIKGQMTWRPWQKDGAVGTLTGKLISKNEILLEYKYMIEGNRQTEQKIMKIEDNKLYIKRGELIDPKNDGNLIFKDVSKVVYNEILRKTSCD